jgi:hypothetical protein
LLQDRRLIKIPHHAACCRAGKHPAGGEKHDHKTQEEGPGPPQGPGPLQTGKAEKASTPDEPFQWPLGDHLTAEQKVQLEELLDGHRDIFAFNMNEMTQIKMRSSRSRSRMTNRFSGANIGSPRLRRKFSRCKSREAPSRLHTAVEIPVGSRRDDAPEER